MKPSTSGANAEMEDYVSISGEARDEHRQRDITMDLDPEPPATEHA